MTDLESSSSDSPGLAEAADLVLRAFALAQASGREDWRVMTVAVLKNRLLDLTHKQFDESRWGASTTREFVGLLDEILEIDPTTRPARVELRPHVELSDAVVAAASEPARTRGGWSIRRDLWDAVVDCASGNVYAWSAGKVLVHEPTEARSIADETEDDVPADRLRLPTLAAEELNAWRREFADEAIAAGADAEMAQTLSSWAASGTSSQALPQRYRNRWFGILKRRVRARLDEWFAAHSIEPPEDLVVSAPVRAIDAGDDIERIRAAARRAIGLMSRDELERLQLPASVVARMLE